MIFLKIQPGYPRTIKQSWLDKGAGWDSKPWPSKENSCTSLENKPLEKEIPTGKPIIFQGPGNFQGVQNEMATKNSKETVVSCFAFVVFERSEVSK